MNTGESVPAHEEVRASVRGQFVPAVLAAGAALICAGVLAATAAAHVLPDNRAYELVSPVGDAADPFTPEVYSPYVPQSHQGDFNSWFPFRAASDGQAVAYVADPPSSEGSGVTGGGFGNEWLATRTSDGWHAQDLQPAPLIGEEAWEAFGSSFVGFTENLSFGMMRAESRALAAATEPQGAAQCTNIFLRDSATGSLRPLYTASNSPGECGQPILAGSSQDGSHVIFQTGAALTPEATPANGGGEEDLYEWHDGQLKSVNVLPGGAPDPNATFGGPSTNPEEPTASLPEFPDFTNAISRDGTRIFWTDLGTHDVYMREDGTRTVQVSAGAAKYMMATPDGAYALYLENGELWRYDTSAGTREELSGTGAAVLGVLAISSDGRYVYFVSGEALAPGAPSGNCTQAAPGSGASQSEQEEEGSGKLPPGRGCNLYLSSNGTSVKFITTVAPKDNNLIESATSAHAGLWAGSTGLRTAEATADGRSLVFESTIPLTGYDTSGLESVTSDHDQALEVFVYNADANQLLCISCSPSGAPPLNTGEGKGLTLLPITSNNTYMRRWISEDGNRVFFDTSQPLAPEDTNGVQDVYEWEREGTGSCVVQAQPMRDGGCVSLLSGGDVVDYSSFVDASANGDDAFFTTLDRLVPQDRDEVVALYDARVGGGFPEAGGGCVGEQCPAPAPQAPNLVAPASGTFAGSGNLPASTRTKGNSHAKHRSLTRAQQLDRALRVCRKHERTGTKRSRCEARARKAHVETDARTNKKGSK